MSRLQSRAQREAAFAKLATYLHTQLEDWYDQHPAASFGEIEQEACRLRREFMGQGLAVVINGREPVSNWRRRSVRSVHSRCRLWAIGPGGCRAWKGRRS